MGAVVRTFLAVTGLLASVVPLPVFAAEFIGGEQELVSPAGPVEDDLFAAGSQVDIDEPVRDDVFAAGSTVATRAEVGGNVFAAAEMVSISAAVQDDVHAAGKTVRVSGAVAGDVFAVANQVLIDRGATIGGDVYAAGGEVLISGTVQGDVHSAGQRTLVAETAVIAGNVTVYGGFAPVIADGADIRGETTHRPTAPAEEREFQEQLGWWVRSTLGWFIFAALLLYVFPRFMQRCVDAAFTRGGVSLGVGALWLLVGVPLGVVLGAIVIGWPAVVLVVFGTVADVIAALALAIVVIGAWLVRTFTKTAQPLRWQHALAGAVAMKLLLLVPVIGGLLMLVLLLLAVGAGWLVVWQAFGQSKQAKHHG